MPYLTGIKFIEPQTLVPSMQHGVQAVEEAYLTSRPTLLMNGLQVHFIEPHALPLCD